jgi:predicted enzyme related to lactoylglutathione lyase
MEGVGYWRIRTGAMEGPALHGGLTYRAISDLNDLMPFVNVSSLDETAAQIQHLGGSIIRPKTAVPKTAWVTNVADPAKNIFGIWQADSHQAVIQHFVPEATVSAMAC